MEANDYIKPSQETVTIIDLNTGDAHQTKNWLVRKSSQMIHVVFVGSRRFRTQSYACPPQVVSVTDMP